MSDNEFKPDYVIPPGETLAETLEYQATADEAIHKAGLSKEILGGILSGDTPITTEIAGKLESITGVPEHIWINLEKNYRVLSDKTDISA